MTKEEKTKAIKKIEKKQMSILRQFAKTAKLPAPKTPLSAIKRAAKLCGFQIMINQLQSDKFIVATEPNPKFPKGGKCFKSPNQYPFINKEEKIFKHSS